MQPETVDIAVSYLFNYYKYDVIKNNFYIFERQCVSGEDVKPTGFSALNHKMAVQFENNYSLAPSKIMIVLWHLLRINLIAAPNQRMFIRSIVKALYTSFVARVK